MFIVIQSKQVYGIIEKSDNCSCKKLVKIMMMENAKKYIKSGKIPPKNTQKEIPLKSIKKIKPKKACTKHVEIYSLL